MSAPKEPLPPFGGWPARGIRGGSPIVRRDGRKALPTPKMFHAGMSLFVKNCKGRGMPDREVSVPRERNSSLGNTVGPKRRRGVENRIIETGDGCARRVRVPAAPNRKRPDRHTESGRCGTGSRRPGRGAGALPTGSGRRPGQCSSSCSVSVADSGVEEGSSASGATTEEAVPRSSGWLTFPPRLAV